MASMIHHPRQTCFVCKQQKHCGIMIVKNDDGKGAERQRVCGECWDDTYVKRGSGVIKQRGGRRVIRGTDSLT